MVSQSQECNPLRDVCLAEDNGRRRCGACPFFPRLDAQERQRRRSRIAPRALVHIAATYWPDLLAQVQLQDPEEVAACYQSTFGFPEVA